MRILYGTVDEIVDVGARLIKCSSDEGHGQYTVELLFSHHNIEVGDKVLIFLLSSMGYTSNYALPFSKKNDHNLDNIKIFFTPDTIIEMNKDSITIQKSYPEDNQEENNQNGQSGNNNNTNNTQNSEEEEEKKHNYIYIDQNTITIHKAMRSEIILTDDTLSINKFNEDNESIAYIDFKDDKITIQKGGQGQDKAVIEITDNDFKLEVKNINLLSASGGTVKIPGSPQSSATPKGGFSQILHCPFTGLPHNTDTLVASP